MSSNPRRRDPSSSPSPSGTAPWLPRMAAALAVLLALVWAGWAGLVAGVPPGQPRAGAAPGPNAEGDGGQVIPPSRPFAASEAPGPVAAAARRDEQALEVCGWGLLPAATSPGVLPEALREFDARVQQRFVERALASGEPRLRLLGHWWAGTLPGDAGERALLAEAAASDPVAAQLAGLACRQVQGDVEVCNPTPAAARVQPADDVREWLLAAHRADSHRAALPLLERAARARGDYDSGTRDIVRAYRQLADSVTTDALARGLLDQKLMLLLASLPVPGFAVLLEVCQAQADAPAPAFCGPLGERLVERSDDPVAVALGAAVLRRIEHPSAARAAARAGDLVEAQRLWAERAAPAGQGWSCAGLAARSQQQAALAAYGEVGAGLLALTQAERGAPQPAGVAADAGTTRAAPPAEALASPFGRAASPEWAARPTRAPRS